MVSPSYTWRIGLFPMDLDPDGHLPAEALVTVETDDTLVLAPDGLGGVAFRAEAGGGSMSDPHWKYVLDAATGTVLIDAGTGAGIEAWE